MTVASAASMGEVVLPVEHEELTRVGLAAVGPTTVFAVERAAAALERVDQRAGRRQSRASERPATAVSSGLGRKAESDPYDAETRMAGGCRLEHWHRAGRTRTCNPRFWRPVLCQLSYGPTRLGEEALYRRASEAPRSTLPRPRGRVRRRRRLRRALGGRCVGGRGRGRRPRGLDGGVGAAGAPVGKAAISDESLILRGDGRAG